MGLAHSTPEVSKKDVEDIVHREVIDRTYPVADTTLTPFEQVFMRTGSQAITGVFHIGGDVNQLIRMIEDKVQPRSFCLILIKMREGSSLLCAIKDQQDVINLCIYQSSPIPLPSCLEGSLSNKFIIRSSQVVSQWMGHHVFQSTLGDAVVLCWAHCVLVTAQTRRWSWETIGLMEDHIVERPQFHIERFASRITG